MYELFKVVDVQPEQTYHPEKQKSVQLFSFGEKVSCGTELFNFADL